MKLSNAVYDILKWITMIVIPALATAYVGLAAVWGWPYADEVAKTAAVVCTLLGALLGISTAQYNLRNNETPPYLGRHESPSEIASEIDENSAPF